MTECEANCLSNSLARMTLPGHRAFSAPQAHWCIADRPGGSSLVIARQFDEARFEAQLDEVLVTYQREGQYANWIIPPAASPAALGRRLRRKHFMGPRYLPGMQAQLRALPLKEPQWPTRAIERWEEMGTAAWSAMMPKASRADADLLYRQLQEAALAHHVATWIEGQLAATAYVHFHGATAGIYAVSTFETMRGRGAAKAVMQGCFRLAAEHGSQVVSLQAAPGLGGFYEKQGLEQVCTFTSLYYSRTRSAEDWARRTS